jgi:hypothetical protein
MESYRILNKIKEANENYKLTYDTIQIIADPQGIYYFTNKPEKIHPNRINYDKRNYTLKSLYADRFTFKTLPSHTLEDTALSQLGITCFFVKNEDGANYDNNRLIINFPNKENSTYRNYIPLILSFYEIIKDTRLRQNTLIQITEDFKESKNAKYNNTFYGVIKSTIFKEENNKIHINNDNKSFMLKQEEKLNNNLESYIRYTWIDSKYIENTKSNIDENYENHLQSIIEATKKTNFIHNTFNTFMIKDQRELTYDRENIRDRGLSSSIPDATGENKSFNYLIEKFSFEQKKRFNFKNKSQENSEKIHIKKAKCIFLKNENENILIISFYQEEDNKDVIKKLKHNHYDFVLKLILSFYEKSNHLKNIAIDKNKLQIIISNDRNNKKVSYNDTVDTLLSRKKRIRKKAIRGNKRSEINSNDNVISFVDEKNNLITIKKTTENELETYSWKSNNKNRQRTDIKKKIALSQIFEESRSMYSSRSQEI